MLYNQYLAGAVNTTEIFQNACNSIALKYPNAAEAQAACWEAANDYAARQSYESYENFMDAASHLAETLLFGTPGIGSQDLQNIESAISDYSASAQNIANTYIGNREDEPSNLEWLQVQDDGVYISGKGNSSPSFPWPDIIPTTRPPRRKYPEGVPLVPPQPITTAPPKIKKIKPITPNGSGCVNKTVPTPGKFWLAIEAPYVGGLAALLYWDNMIARRTWFKHNYPQKMYWEEWFAGSPLGMPSEIGAELMSTFKKGRYAITGVSHNETLSNPTAYPYYIMSEGWGWEYKFPDGTTATSQHGDDWEECLFIELGSSYYYYHFPNSAGNWTTEGEGHAAAFTCGRVHLTYLGDTFAPVTETPEETPENVGAYLAFQQIHAFNNILFTILGGNHGKP